MKRLCPILLLVLTACATAQIDMPDGSFAVQGANPRRWNQPISFGEWHTESVNEGTTRSWLIDTKVLDVAKSDQAYRMVVNGINVECHMRELTLGAAGVFIDPSLGRNPILVCGYERPPFTRTVLALSRTGRPEPALQGELREIGGPALQVRSIHRAHGSRFASSEPFGFEILSGDNAVAMVETINQGRVWIDPDARANRDTLAAVAASLLLFREAS
ncbi:MAG: hypothetical protein M3Q69_04690 [Acidobacteriota bacterium]|nr:hypothetical protein [Acidobacteriota bacterium]